MSLESKQYDGSLRKREEELVKGAIAFLGEGEHALDFATASQMERLRDTYDQHVEDRHGPIQTVGLPIAHNPEHVGAHVSVIARNSGMNEALLPAGLMARASLNQIPYDSELSPDFVRTQLGPELNRRMHELEFNAVRRGVDEGGVSPVFDQESGRMKQDWLTRFPPGSEFRIGTTKVLAKDENGQSFTRPGYALYLKTTLPQHTDSAIRMKGKDSKTVGELIDSGLVSDAQDYASRNHQRVLHEMGQVIKEAIGVNHAVFVASDDKKAAIGPHDMYPKLASPTGPSMSLNEIKNIGDIGVALYHSAATDAKGSGNVLVGDYHQPMVLLSYGSTSSRNDRGGIDNTPRTNSFYNAFPSTTRPLTEKEAERAKSASFKIKSVRESVQNSFSPIYTPSEHQVQLHAHSNEIRRPNYTLSEKNIGRHAKFQPFGDAHKHVLTKSQFGSELGMGSNVVMIDPVYSAANLGVQD